MFKPRFLGGIGDQIRQDIAQTGARSVMGYHLGVHLDVLQVPIFRV